MRMTVQSFTSQSARLRRALNYIGHNLDEEIPLAKLADLACLSPSQFIRLYASKVRETPIATLRRLRLVRAHAQLGQGGASLFDTALAASYNSQAAFTHAFVRQFGYAPSRLPTLTDKPEPIAQLRLETLPERVVFQLPYSGTFSEHGKQAGQLSGSLAVGGAKRWRNWQILDRDRPFSATASDPVSVTHFVPAAGLPDAIRGIDRQLQKGGLYAVYETLAAQQPKHLCVLAERIRAELGCQVIEGRILLREINVNSYTAPQERRIASYIPIAPIKT